MHYETGNSIQHLKQSIVGVEALMQDVADGKYLPLERKVAQAINVEFDEALSYIRFKAIEACHKYDTTRKTTFMTFLYKHLHLAQMQYNVKQMRWRRHRRESRVQRTYRGLRTKKPRPNSAELELAELRAALDVESRKLLDKLFSVKDCHVRARLQKHLNLTAGQLNKFLNKLKTEVEKCIS